MKRILTLILLQFFLTQIIQAQCRKIDSLRNTLVLLRNPDSNRVNNLNLLANELLKNGQTKQANFYSVKSQQLAENINFKKGIADAKMVHGKTLESDVIEYTNSPKLYEDALEIYQENKLEKQKSIALKHLGDFYYNFLYLNRDYFDLSLKFYLKYLKVVEKIGAKKEVFDAYTLLIRLYEHEGNDEKSRVYVKKALDLKKELEEEDIDDPHLLLRAEKFAKLQLQNERLLSYSLAAGLILFFIVAILLIYFVIQKQKTNKQLQEQNDEILSKNEIIEEQNVELTQKNEEISSQRDQLIEQNQQILDTQEELQISNENLARTNRELEDAKQKLEDINKYLEVKVEDRTKELNKSNAVLKVVNKELDTLVYRASHDFKGPISTLKGLVQIARMEYEGGSNPTMFFDKIEQTTDNMDSMLTNLHKVSYVIGKDLLNEIIDFNKVLEQVKTEYELELQKANAQINLHISNNVSLYGDFEVWLIIFEKLIENAIHFRKVQETLDIDIEVSQSSMNTEITLKDNGIGIPVERQKKVFEMFYRGSELSRGNGLGLYVVKKSIEKLNGEITVFSKANEFTMFKIQIPAELNNFKTYN